MHGKIKSFKKLYAVLMLVSFVFASVSPAFAVGIFEGKIFSEVGDKTDFAGYNWMLFKKDEKSGYIITTEGIGSSVFRYGISDANLYYSSVLRGKVNDYEKEMKSYTGPQLTWAEVNGTADGKNYIEKHDMSDCANMRPRQYDDLLYLLSVVEAEVLPANILRLGRDKDWWLRSKGSMGPLRVATIHHDVWGNPYVDYPGCEISDTLLVRPALQINLQSPIFAQTAFKTAPTGGKADVKVGDGFTLADYDGSAGWKLTKADSSLPLPDVSILSIMGYTTTILGKVTVNYNGPATGENTYLSALLYDNNGNLINYAKVADTSTNGSGKVELSFKNVLPSGWYRVKFFTERINGEGEPDYCFVSSKEYKIHVGSSNADDDTEANALLLPDSELPEQLKIKDEITQTPPIFITTEQVTGVSGLTKVDSKTRLTMTVEQSGGAKDKQTAKFKIMLGKKIENYDKTKRLVVLIADKTENKTASETPEQTKYTAFKAEYEEDGDFGMLSFSVPEYGKYFKTGSQQIIVAELNEGAKFDLLNKDELPKSIASASVEQAAASALINPEITGASNVKEAVSKTTLNMKLTHVGGGIIKETAKFKIQLDEAVETDESKQLAVLLPAGGNKYTAFPAEYDKENDILTFAVPNYSDYFETGKTLAVTVAEINQDAKFDGENSSSSGGCNAGFGALAMLTLAGLALTRKRNEE